MPSTYSYKTKAKQDVQEVLSRVKFLLEKLGLASDTIAVQEVETFCKFSAFLKVIRYRSIADEYLNPKKEEIGRGFLHSIVPIHRSEAFFKLAFQFLRK